MITRIAIALLLLTTAAHAEDLFYRARYRSGHAGFKKPFEVQIVITDTDLRFDKYEGLRMQRVRPAFSIPLDTIVDVKEDFGLYKYLILKTETADTTEAITLNLNSKTAEEIATKLRFAVRKARERAGLK